MLRKSVSLELEGLNVVGELYLPGEGKGLFPTVCVCHGIPAKSPDPNHKDYPLLAERICHHGFAVLIFNLRGTGASGGNLDILGWTRDLTAAVDYLCTLPEVDKSRLSLLGFSGGGAVSVYVAAQDRRVSSIATCACPAEFGFLTEVNEPQAVINHFRSIGTIRDKDFPYSAREWLGGFRLVNPINYVARIAPRPLLLVHGSRDETVDISQAYKLYDEAWEPKQLIIIDGAEHGLRQNDKAMAAVLDWLESHAQITGSG